MGNWNPILAPWLSTKMNMKTPCRGMEQPQLVTDQNFLTILTRKKLTPKLIMKVDNSLWLPRLKPHLVQNQQQQDRCCKSSCNKLLGVNLSYKMWLPQPPLLQITQPTTLPSSSNA